MRHIRKRQRLFEREIAGYLDNISKYGNYNGGYDDEKLAKNNADLRDKLLKYGKRADILKFNFPGLKDKMYVTTSKDGRLRIYSWDLETGGTMHDYASVFQYRGKSGKVYSWTEKREDESAGVFYHQIFQHRCSTSRYGTRAFRNGRQRASQWHSNKSCPGERKMTANTLKIRDDHQPLRFTAEGDAFKLEDSSQAAWLTGKTFGRKELRNRIEPWLTSLFQSEHLSLLAGSGLTHAVHYLAAGKGAAGMGALALSHHQTEINQAAAKAADAAGREKGNLEDQLRVANELLRGLEILQQKTEAEVLRTELQTGMQDFAKSILKSEEGIASAAEDKREEAFNTLVTFLMSC